MALALAAPLPAPADPSIPAPPQVAAKSWCLAVHPSGDVLGEYQGDKIFEPAGLSKLMTLFLLFEYLEAGRFQLHDRFKVEEEAWRAPGSRMFLKLDSEVRIEDLIAGLILYNANDAALTLASRMADSLEELVELMNQRAELLGMQQTRYTHPAGLADPDSATTACEQLILIRYLRKRFPQYAHFFSMAYHTFLGSVRNNPNALLRTGDGISGMMLAPTNNKRYHAALASSRRGLALDFAMLGAGSLRSSQRMSSSLLNHFYRYYQSLPVFGAREPLCSVSVLHGKPGRLALGVLDPVAIVIPYGQEGELELQYQERIDFIAPVRYGQSFGSLRVLHNGEALAVAPLVALHEVNRSHWAGRIWDNIHNLFSPPDQLNCLNDEFSSRP